VTFALHGLGRQARLGDRDHHAVAGVEAGVDERGGALQEVVETRVQERLVDQGRHGADRSEIPGPRRSGWHLAA
jgi:hypothetical protein